MTNPNETPLVSEAELSDMDYLHLGMMAGVACKNDPDYAGKYQSVIAKILKQKEAAKVRGDGWIKYNPDLLEKGKIYLYCKYNPTPNCDFIVDFGCVELGDNGRYVFVVNEDGQNANPDMILSFPTPPQPAEEE